MAKEKSGIKPFEIKTRAPVLGRQEAVNAAVLRKLILPNGKDPSTATQGKVTNIPTQQELLAYAKETIRTAVDADTVFETLPDVQLAADLSVSTILACKDLVTTNLFFECEDRTMPLSMKTRITALIKDHFDTTYPIRDYMRDILMDTLFMTGSYGVSVIPESSIDRLINSGSKTVGLEDLQKNNYITKDGTLPLKGILGSIDNKSKTGAIGLEAFLRTEAHVPKSSDMCIKFTADSGAANPMDIGVISITDNLDVCSLPNIKRKMVSDVVKQTTRVGLEHIYSGVETVDLSTHKTGDKKTKPIDSVEVSYDAHRASVGRPLIKHWPSESIIPVHAPGDFKSLAGVLIIIDETGNGISRHGLLGNHTAYSWILGDATTEATQRAAASMGLGAAGVDVSKLSVAKLQEAFTEIVEGKLVSAIKNGVYGESATIARPEEVYRIMMARALANRNTQILFIPSEQFAYFAVDYNEWGIGRSLMEKNAILSAIRTALALTTVISTVRNATPNIQYTITLDPDDREGKKSVTEIKDLIAKSFNSKFPLKGTPDDMTNYIDNCNIHFNIEGNQYYPSTKITVEDNSPDYKVPDTTVDEDFARKQYRSMICDPDLVINPENIEFAAQVHSKSLLTTSRAIIYQNLFNPHFTHFTKTIVMSDGFLLSEIVAIINEEMEAAEVPKKAVAKYINQYMASFRATLPPPDNTSIIKNQMEAFDEYSQAIEKIIEPWINNYAFEGSGVAESSDRIKAIVMSHYQRKWLRERDVEPELTDFFDSLKGDDASMEAIIEMVDEMIDIGKVNGLLVKRLTSRLTKLDEGLALPEDEGSADMGSESTDMGGDEGGEGGEGDFGGEGGEDDFGGGEDDFGGEDSGGEDDMGGEADPEADADGEGDAPEDGDDADMDLDKF